MAVKEAQTTIKIYETEKKDLISAIEKLTENKIIEFLKSIRLCNYQ